MGRARMKGGDVVRQITHVHKDNNDVITQCYSSGAWQAVSTIVTAIDRGFDSYFTEVNGRRADVITVPGVNGKYLRSTPDGTNINNLDYLPTA